MPEDTMTTEQGRGMDVAAPTAAALRFIRGSLEDLEAGRCTPSGALAEILLTARAGLYLCVPERGRLVESPSGPLSERVREVSAGFPGAPVSAALSYLEGIAIDARIPDDLRAALRTVSDIALAHGC